MPPQSCGNGPYLKLSSSLKTQTPLRTTQIHFEFLTLFPETIEGFLSSSILKRASDKGYVSFGCTQIRDFAQNKHKTVDDTPYGGGPGMLLRADVLDAAWVGARSKVSDHFENHEIQTLLLSPQGRVLDQPWAKELAEGRRAYLLVCGHYEGLDERFIQSRVDLEVSIGNFILTGGELPALVIADTVSRLVSGVLGNAQSASTDSLEGGLVKYPQYTRPREYKGESVPEVLLSGDHGKIAQWRVVQSYQRTQEKRPDLLVT